MMNIEMRQVQIDGESALVIYPAALGFKRLENSPLKIVFSNDESEKAVIYSNAAGEKICAPEGLKRLLGL